MAQKRGKSNAPRSYSMPEMSELYPQPPFEYRDSTSLLIHFKTDPRVLRKLVPAPLTPNKDASMFMSVAEFMASGFGHYYEAHLFTQVTYKRQLYNYSLYLILDNDIAIGAGREIWGFPKKLGRLTMNLTDDVVHATVERGGITVIDASMHLATFDPLEDLTSSPHWIARKFVPSITIGEPPAVDQLTATELTNIAVRESYRGDARLSFGASPADRFDAVPIKKVVEGYYYRTDFTLGDGAVLHDYLA